MSPFFRGGQKLQSLEPKMHPFIKANFLEGLSFWFFVCLTMNSIYYEIYNYTDHFFFDQFC